MNYETLTHIPWTKFLKSFLNKLLLHLSLNVKSFDSFEFFNIDTCTKFKQPQAISVETSILLFSFLSQEAAKKI